MIIDPADLIAIRRALEMAGRDGARAELLRRFPAVKYERVEAALDYLLAMPVEPPPSHAGHKEAKRDAPGHTRRNRKRT